LLEKTYSFSGNCASLSWNQGSHLYTQPFGFSTPGNNAAIVVTENDDRFAAQIRPENLLATGVEGVDVGQGEHQSALRVL
jgi:hypothetical protein